MAESLELSRCPETSRALLLALLLYAVGSTPAAAEPGSAKSGKAIYDFYCYQCHGYTGDGDTLAASYVSPKPRDFTRADPNRLDRSRMLESVARGREGTAMVSFVDVIDAAGRERVVDFIRSELMDPSAPQRLYHTAENGWPDHDQYADAFPFATGTLALSVDPATLTDAERHGRARFLGACVTCHDRGGAEGAPLQWDLKPLSYPRRHYSHRRGHLITGASPYAVHDRRPDYGELTPAQAAGGQLYEANCAFCHAMDGTGKNWIGRFLEPHPRDLTSPNVALLGRAELEARIARGLPGTSMPGWSDVLSPDEIGAIITFMIDVLTDPTHSGNSMPASVRPPPVLSWQLLDPS